MRKIFFSLLVLLSLPAAADSLQVQKILARFEKAFKTDGRQALKIISEAEPLLTHNVSRRLAGFVYRRKGDAYVQTSDLDSAKIYFDKADHTVDANDYWERGNIANSRSNIYSRSGNLQKAIECLLEALHHYEKSNSVNNNWAVLQNLAICYAQTGMLDKAASYLWEVIDILKKIKASPAQIGDVYTNMGVVFEMKNQPDSAFKMYRIAYDLHSTEGQSAGLAMLLNNMGSVLLKQQKVKEGIEYLNKSLSMLQATGDMEGSMMAMNNIADVFCESGKYDQAMSYALRSYRFADSLKYPNRLTSACDLLAKIYSKTGNYQKAYEYCRRFSSMNDSLKNRDNMKTVAELEAKYENDKKEKAIELLNKDKALQQSQLSKEKNFRYSLIGISALVLTIAFLLFISLKRKQKTNRELDLKNQKIEMAYSIIEEKQKEILDSIHYAKRIQKSLLPTEKYIIRSLKQR